MASPARQRMTPFEYFEIEQRSGVRHEYLDGAAWAMAGGTPDHSRISSNVITLLNTQLRGRPCVAFESNLKIAVRATGLKTYPDASVICGKLELDPDDHTKTTATNPTVIVEVLSKSTEDYDRGEKVDHYKQISTVQEIVLIDSRDRHVEVWSRKTSWLRSELRSGSVELESISCSLPIDELYRDPFNPAAPPS